MDFNGFYAVFINPDNLINFEKLCDLISVLASIKTTVLFYISYESLYFY